MAPLVDESLARACRTAPSLSAGDFQGRKADACQAASEMRSCVEMTMKEVGAPPNLNYSRTRQLLHNIPGRLVPRFQRFEPNSFLTEEVCLVIIDDHTLPFAMLNLSTLLVVGIELSMISLARTV